MLRVLALAATETILLVDKKYSCIVIILGGFTIPSEHLRSPHMLLKEVQALFCAMFKHYVLRFVCTCGDCDDYTSLKRHVLGDPHWIPFLLHGEYLGANYFVLALCSDQRRSRLIYFGSLHTIFCGSSAVFPYPTCVNTGQEGVRKRIMHALVLFTQLKRSPLRVLRSTLPLAKCYEHEKDTVFTCTLSQLMVYLSTHV